MTKRITILGSTGSIGQSALEVVRRYPNALSIAGLAAHSNIDLLLKQIDEFKPDWVAVSDPHAAHQLSESISIPRLFVGPEGLEELASQQVDVVLCGIVGAAGLPSILSAIENKNRVALANKEPMVMAGNLIMDAARHHNVEVLPVDSEHNAIFQCLQGHNIDDVHKIHLTASGGPFYRSSREVLKNVTPEEAGNHPTWDMGAKISIDSATLMNKGLEIIEAMWLFDLPLEKINVVIHPQSIIHSLVEFTDGSILAHLGVTNMTLPIQFALTWPNRVKSPMARLDLTTMPEITFAAPDFSQFPCLAMAMEAARTGGTAGAILNAANETAVAAFRDHTIPFLGIEETVKSVMKTSTFEPVDTLEGVLEADREARQMAKDVIRSRSMA
ncbi:MAG: 1-deoxy-D-xylulose-5-phosphate reductoisomerase [Candidatus Hydrogenedentota bacterium]|nr:MAG: 1-deoxy-D-xylulose-5-phosphate reductoisomerase [Candidatus Hydrogenedentota bacterium]